jgi:hypothetical protein
MGHIVHVGFEYQISEPDADKAREAGLKLFEEDIKGSGGNALARELAKYATATIREDGEIITL